MNTTILVEAGLTEAQAIAYKKLVENSPITPPALTDLTKESRSNTYKILEQLEDLGLAQRDESEKKIKYWAMNPAALLQHVEEEQHKSELRAKQIKNSLPELVNTYLKHNEQPGIYHYQGKGGIVDIYDDQKAEGKNITFIRSTDDVRFFSYEEMRKLRGSFAKKGVNRHVFSPDARDVPINWRETDPIRKLTRTWMKTKDYTAPVEISVYGNKVSFISFGEEAIGMVIESQQIALAMKQIFSMLDEGLKRRPDYKKLPAKAKVMIIDSLEIGKGKHVFTDSV